MSENEHGEAKLAGNDIKIRSSEGGEFDCYASLPDFTDKVPAIVLACSVMGVDKDLRNLADTFAAAGFIAYAPDLFWRTEPGPVPPGDERIKVRSQPREEKIKEGEVDFVDVTAAVRALAQSNGKVAIAGYCYGGPYAAIGPRRLGYDAGIGCHSSQMWSYVDDLKGVTQPVCLIWGDQDHAYNDDVKAIYPKLAEQMTNLEVHVLPGILHGYMMAGSVKAFDQKAYDFSMERSLAILSGLRGDGAPQALRKAS